MAMAIPRTVALRPSSRGCFGQEAASQAAARIHMGVNPKIGEKPPKWMVKIMEKPMNKWMIRRYFFIFGNLQFAANIQQKSNTPI